MKRARQLLIPRSVAFLGELGSCVLHNPRSQSFFTWAYRPGRILCLAPDESCLYILKPIITDEPVRPDALALNARDLYERFHHRRGDAFYNCFVPPPRRPRFAGELVIIRYLSDKDLPGAPPSDGPVEYEHYFEEPGVAPAYPELWAIGRDQYVVPPGPWRVTSRGIEFGSHRGLPFTEAA